jgi:8-oxo-dGTP diphosphatase
MPDILLSAKAIIKKDGKILLLKDSKTKFWDLPGGHLKDNETLEEGLKREVKEETGLNLSSCKQLTTRQLKLGSETKPVCFYLCTADGELDISNEHKAFKWISLKDLDEYDTGKFEDIIEDSKGMSIKQYNPDGLQGQSYPLKEEGMIKDVDPAFKEKIADRIPDLETPIQQKVLGRLKLLMEKMTKASDQLSTGATLSKPIPGKNKNAFNTVPFDNETASRRTFIESRNKPMPKALHKPNHGGYRHPIQEEPNIQNMQKSLQRIEKQLILDKTEELIQKAEQVNLIDRFVEEYRNKLILKEEYLDDVKLFSLAEEINTIKGFKIDHEPVEVHNFFTLREVHTGETLQIGYDKTDSGSRAFASAGSVVRPTAVAKALYTERAKECNCTGCNRNGCIKALNAQLFSSMVRKSVPLETGRSFWKLYDKAITGGVDALSDQELVILREFLYARA